MKHLKLIAGSKPISLKTEAITAVKRGSYLLKYGRRGKPKFCPVRLSNLHMFQDETMIIWYVGKQEKQLQLSNVSRIIPGQRTAIFQRYPRPEKEYQSFSLIYSNRSLDLICKDKDEAEVWFAALRALISRGNCQKWRNEARSDSASSDSSSTLLQRNSKSFASSSSSDIVYEDRRSTQTFPLPFETFPQRSLGRAFSDFALYNSVDQGFLQGDFIASSLSSQSSGGLDDLNGRSSADTSRVSLSSAVSSSAPGSPLQDFNTPSDVFFWGEGISDGVLGGGEHRIEESSAARIDALWPKALESTLALDAQNIACGSKHAVLVTKKGEIFSWGEGSGGRLGHGVEADVNNPKLINALSGLHIKSVTCGENHTCAVTVSGDLYTWGDGINNFGLLGHGTELSYWTPKKIVGGMEGMHVSFVSCGPWHSAAVTSAGLLFTFGDGTFGALGHGDRASTSVPREVETLKGLRTLRVSCGVWHTAAVVEVTSEPSSSDSCSSVKLFTWGDGEKGQLGHGDKDPRLFPSSVAVLNDTNCCQVVCGHSITIVLTTLGQVYTTGSSDYGQLRNPGSAGMLPICIEGNIRNNFIEQIACGYHHVAVLSSQSEVYTWGKGANGQLGHGDFHDRNAPTLVEALADKQVKRVVCGSNFTAAICLNNRLCTADHSMCSGCRTPFNYRRKRHNCYNCGLVFCKLCTSKRSLKAALAPKMNKPYRVCEDCFAKLNKGVVTRSSYRPPKATSGSKHCNSAVKDPETLRHKSQGLLSRLSSFDSFRRTESRKSKQYSKLDSSNESLRRESSNTTDSSTLFECSEKVSASITGSTVNSRAASPVSVNSSPHSTSLTSTFAALAYPDAVLDDSKRTTDNLTKDISILREQVEVLSHRAQLLEAEVGRTSRQLKEATRLAMDEREKNKAAKEVIKSLTMQ
ncbi:hypothetical protein RJ639_012560, partial [Escallonia herrerae]